MSKRLNLPHLLINTSLLLYFIVITVRTTFFSQYTLLYLILLSVSILLLIINLIKTGISAHHCIGFFLLCVAMFLPSLYHNAYLEKNMYASFLYYALALLYCVLLYFNQLQLENFTFILKLLIIFAVITSLVTWYSYFAPNSYITQIISRFSPTERPEIYTLFTRFDNRMGLTNHYSRNAFFILLGALSSLYFYQAKKPRYRLQLGLLFFFILTMFLVGKRGHLLFLIISLGLSYLIFYKASLQKFLKLFGILCISLTFTLAAIQFIPGANFFLERFTTSTTDITNGRSVLYDKTYALYQANDYLPIGWGQFAKSVNFSSPGTHNDYLQLFCETGIIGLILVIGSNLIILFRAIKYAKVQSSPLAFLALTFNLFFLIYSLTGLPHFDTEVYMTYFLFNSFLYFYSDQSLVLSHVAPQLQAGAPL